MDLHGGNIYRMEREFGFTRGEILDFSSNINPLGVPRSLKKAIGKNIDILAHYPDPKYVDLKRAIAEYCHVETDGSQTSPSAEPIGSQASSPAGNIIVGNGSTEILFHYIRAIKPSRTLIINPTYAEYERAVRIEGGDVQRFMLREDEGFELNIDSLAKEMSKGYDLLVICNPNNPTGNFTAPDKMKKIIEIAAKKDTRVLADEAFIEFADAKMGTAPHFYKNRALSPFFPKNLFIMRSLTKFFAIPGLRLGYGLTSDKDLSRKLEDSKEPWTVNAFAALAGEIFLKDEDYIERSRLWMKKEGNFMRRELRKIKGIQCYDSAANFFLIKITNGMTADDVQQKLIRRGILIRNASNFPFLDHRFIRVGVKRREENRILLKNLKELIY